MKTEYEIRILEIDKEKMIEKLENLGATKKGEFNQKRYVYDLKPIQEDKWIRLRANGEETTLTYKSIEADTIDGTKEVEIKVDDFDVANEFLNKLGFIARNYQENIRIQYILDDVEIDIDTWPMIPTYLEIEGKSKKEVNDMIKKLNLENSKITLLNCNSIYKKIYNIDISKTTELKFKK